MRERGTGQGRRGSVRRVNLQRAPEVRTLQYVIPQLPSITPALLVYLVGVILSLVHLKQLPKPATFALVGCGMLFLTTSVFPFLQGYLVASRDDLHWRLQDVALWTSVVGIVRALFHATAFSLLLAAIFAGRSAPAGPR
jgi:hypothetical protein